MSKPKRRYILPGTLIAAGLVGLGLAAASELELNWNGTFQAGDVEVAADCQPASQEISVKFAEPEFDGAVDADSAPWTSDIEFTGVHAACKNMAYETAVKTTDLAINSTEWIRLTGAVGGGSGTVDGTRITAPLGSLDPQLITNVALTIHGEPAAG